MRNILVTGITCSLFLAFAGCGTTTEPKKEAATTATPTVATATSSNTAMEAAKPAETFVQAVTVPEYLDPMNALYKDRSVFFDYNEFGVKSDFNKLVELHGKYLAKNPKLGIRIEGNTDERGSAEYNLALGQKRAQAVVTALKVYGATDNQMEAVSWGEEKPRASGHTEADFAQNRRADIVYPAK